MEHRETDKGRRSLARMDFAIEVIRSDESTRTITVRLKLDPRRYSRLETNGKIEFFDRYLKHILPEEEFTRSARQLVGLPIYELSPHVESISKYSDSRKAAIASELRGGVYVAPDEKAEPHSELRIATNVNLVFLSVDICGGTALRRASQTAFDSAYKMFMKELGAVVGHFHGSILKSTGDGFIAYIDHPAFTRQCDNAIDMGVAFLSVLRDCINPALAQANYPKIVIRVGADFGEAQKRVLEVPATGFRTTEVASNALNLAVKIQESCAEGEFRIGRNLYELIHVQWLERSEEVAFESGSVGMPLYQVYRVR